MAKKFLSLLLSLATAATAFAQINGDGYYRVQNYKTARWAYLTDNHAAIDFTATKIDLAAIKLWMNPEKYQSDPSTIIYISNVNGDEYDLTAQGTGVHLMTDYYLTIKYRSNYDAYLAYGTYSGVRRDLTDPITNLYIDESYMSDKGNGEYSYWYIKPVSADSDNYFGIKPTISLADGSLYAAMFCGFPYQLAEGDKAYYVSQIDAKHGVAIYSEVPGGIVGQSAAVFQKLTSESPSDNRVVVGAQGASDLAGNQLKGVYFDRDDYAHVSFTAYAPSTMRLLGVGADGKLAYITADVAKIPANTSYLTVPEGSPAEYKLMTPAEYQAYIDNLPIEAESMTLSEVSISIKEEEGFQLFATVAPDNTTDKSVAWASSNPAVATVSDDGYVTGVSAGTAVVTATCGSVSAVCSVEVTEKNGIEAVEADALGLKIEGGAIANTQRRNFCVYNMQGQLAYLGCDASVALPKGLYIVVCEGKAFKAAIR